MKIFLSYPAAHKETAASINYELQAGGHEVFFDREDLPAGQSYNDRIRGAIEDCELFIFMITPESVSQGRYALTELKIAGRKWPDPAGRVLPVMLEPTPFEDIPAYLKAVTILTPEGNVAAEVLLEIAGLAAQRVEPTKADRADEEEIESISYRPIEIRFGRGGPGACSVAVTESPAGSLPAQPCPLDPEALDNLLWSSGTEIAGSARRGQIETGRESLLPSADAVKQVGQQLYESLFTSHLQACLQESMRSVNPQRGEGLRFLINTTDAPELARLPWEFLYSPDLDDFLFSDRFKPVIRWLDVDQPPPTLVVHPPLRLLIAIASPKDRPELSVGAELAHLDDALRDLVAEGRVEAMRLEHATLEALDNALLRNKPHVLHFIGHGDFLGDDGVVVLEAETPPGGADPITGRRLGVLLRNHLGSLRFVFLNSCLGAAVSRRDPFGGVAQSLIRRGIPAVIAMQFPIPDGVAVTLARHFYRYLAAGLPVDAALTSARAFLFARGYPVEWGAPALHMRTPNGRLFEVGATQRPANLPPRPLSVTAPAPAPEEGEPPVTFPQAAAAEGALLQAPGRRWPWLALALLVGLSASAVVFWPRLPKEAPPQTDSSPPPLVGSVPEPKPAIKGKGESQTTTGARPKPAEPRPPAQSGSSAAPPPPPAADYANYQVQSGDTLWGIAAARYGDPTLWPQIYNANREQISDPKLIYPNQELVLPILTRGVTAGLQPTRQHRVKAGDNLWNIAAELYGDPRLWRKIYGANRERITDPDLIFPAQELSIPRD